MIKLFLFLFTTFSAFATTTVTLQVKKPNHSLLMRTENRILEFRPNASLHWGIKISGDFFYAEYGGKIKDTNYGNSQVGNNSYKSYRIGLPIQNFFLGLYYQEWEGFSSNENKEAGCNFCLERENLLSRNGSINLIYAFNPAFSMKALNSNGANGVVFSHSFLLTGFYDRIKIRDHGGLLQGDSNAQFPIFANLQMIEARQLGAGVGYGVLYPFGPFYFGLASLIGAGYQDNRLVDNNFQISHQTGTALHWSTKVMLATQGKGLNFGLKGYLFSNIYRIGDDTNLASLNYNLYFYTAYSW